MHRSPTLIFFICLLSMLVRAQYNTEFINFENTGRSVSVNADYDAGSNGMQTDMMNKILFGGYLDKNVKDRALNKMRGYNQVGINLNYDVSVFFGKKPKYTWLLGFKNQEILNATYTKDFFELAFYGNKPFLGKTANFSGTNVNALRFQEIKFGVLIQKIDTSAKIAISLSFLKGEQLLYIKANKNSSLYTNDDGTDLLFQSNFNLALSDTSARNSKNILSFNGVGASADVMFETPYKSRLGYSVLTVNANNLGFIHWRNNSVQYSSDSAIHFDGYHINNIFDLKDSTLKKLNADSAVRQILNARHEEFNTNIPTNLVIINKIYFGKRKFATSIGFRYIFHANYKPYTFIEPEIRIKSKLTLSLHVGYGGYTRLNLGLGITYSTQGWFFKLGSNSLQGVFAPQIAYGSGVYLSIAKKFAVRTKPSKTLLSK